MTADDISFISLTIGIGICWWKLITVNEKLDRIIEYLKVKED